MRIGKGLFTNLWSGLIAMLLVCSFGCASLTPQAPPPQIPHVPAVVATVDGNLKDYLTKSLVILDKTTIAADEASFAYLEAEKAGVVPPELATAIRAGFRTFAQQVLDGLAQLKKGVATWEQMRALLQPIVDRLNALIDDVNRFRAMVPRSAPASTSNWVTSVFKVAELLTTVTRGGLPDDLARAGGVQ